MDIFPALDLQNGQCVRLRQGDFQDATVYESDPFRQAQRFANEGAPWLHIVDLDGARQGRPTQNALLKKLASCLPLRLQIGGGIRTLEMAQAYLQAGAQRIVLGSLAALDPAATLAFFERFGAASLVLALDVRIDESGIPVPLVKGWQQAERASLWDLLETYAGKSGISPLRLLCTDVLRDGMLSGPNFSLYEEIRRRFPSVDIVASGGVRHSDDLRQLRRLGVQGAIVGKALYEKRLTLREAMEAANAG